MIVSQKGLGDTSATVAKTVPTLLSTAGAVGTSVLTATGVVGAHAAAGTLAASSLAVPIIGAAIAGVTILVGMWLGNIAKHNAEKTAATKIAEEGAEYIKQNLEAYQSQPTHTQAEKDQALANFDNIWAQIVHACGDPSLEDAGKRCISERDVGGKYSLFAYGRDPIAASVVVSNSTALADTIQNAALGVSPLVMAGIAALGLALLVMGD